MNVDQDPGLRENAQTMMELQAKSMLLVLQGETLFKGVTTRRMHGDDDVQAFKDFDDRHFFTGYNDGSIPSDHRPAPLELEMVKKAMAQDYVQGVYDAEGQLIATLWAEPNDEKGDMHVTNVEVAEDHRSERIAHYLLDVCEQAARARGMKTLSLDVDPLNSKAIGLYFKDGYVVTNYKNADDPEVVEFGLQHYVGMTKHLTDQPPIIPDSHAMVAAGEDAKIEAILSGPRPYVGVQFEGRGLGEDARMNKIFFVRPEKKSRLGNVLRRIVRRS